MSSTDSSAPVFPTRVIEPRRGWLAINWGEIWRYRELLYFLTWRDVAVRYKQTVLGILWAFIQPFLKLVVFTVVFGKGAKIDSEGFPYAIFLYSALLPWQFFSEALSRSSFSVAGSANLVTKVYFPRLIIPISSVGSCLVDFAVSFIILAGLMLYYSVPFTTSTLMILPLVVLTIVAALGTGILLSSLNVAYRDFQHIVPYAIQIWFFATPVIYGTKIFSARWQWLISLNPMTGIVDAWRSAILGKPFEWNNLAISAVVALVVFIAGLFYFRRVESSFADVV
jgi:lipopolysaccharide transport system permease protein